MWTVLRYRGEITVSNVYIICIERICTYSIYVYIYIHVHISASRMYYLCWLVWRQDELIRLWLRHGRSVVAMVVRTGDIGEAREKETRTPPDGFVTPAHGKIIQGDLFGQNVGGGLNHPGAYTYIEAHTDIFSTKHSAPFISSHDGSLSSSAANV